jgi:peptidoglycan hydrolase CwlO-like protein
VEKKEKKIKELKEKIAKAEEVIPRMEKGVQKVQNDLKNAKDAIEKWHIEQELSGTQGNLNAVKKYIENLKAELKNIENN